MNRKSWIELIGTGLFLLWIRGLGLLAASIAGMLLIKTSAFYKSEVNFQSTAISATGTIVETREKKEQVYYYSGGIPIPATTTKYIATVEFLTNRGESVKFTTSSACSSRRDCENKSVPVLYSPSSPSNVRVDSGVAPEGMVLGRLMFSLLFLIAGIALVRVDFKKST